MAWTTPRTWTANTVVGAADLNTELRDNLDALKSPPFQQVVTASNANISATASTAIPITGDLAVTLSTNGGPILFGLMGRFSGAVGNANIVLNLNYNGTAFSSRASGLRVTQYEYVHIQGWVTGLPSGSHTFTPTWQQPAGATMTLICSGEPVIFWAREVS